VRTFSNPWGGRLAWRRAAGAAARAALCAAWLLGFALTSPAQGDAGAARPYGPREKDVRRAEKVLAKLRLLEEAAGEDARAFRGVAAKLYPGLFVAVAELREGDLKTDLDTAAFLYAEVGRAWAGAGEAAADCGRERPDIYRPLCLGLRGGTRRQLLAAKARLHTRWAAAVVKTYKGEADAATSRALSEMQAARGNDSIIAARVVETLTPLEGLANASPVHSPYQEQRAASKVSFDRLDAEFAGALDTAGALLSWMPRGPAFYRLTRARRSYSDGLFWYRKVHQSKKMVVSASAFVPDPLKELGLDAERVGHAVANNWRAAARYTRTAEQSLSLAARQ